MLASLQKNLAGRHWYLIAIAIGLLSIWITPKLPIVDFPQHVAQLALLKDLLQQKSQWSDLVTINYYTPNLFVYLLGLTLSFVFSAITSLKILISIAYIGFVFACIQLRKHFNSDPRLDWAFLLPFFGYGYEWGFVTFIISAPLALFFIFFTDKYVQKTQLTQAILVFAFGFLLLESHGLMFLFATGTACFISLVHTKNIKHFAFVITPHLILMSYFVLLFKLNSDFNSSLGMQQYTLNHVDIHWDLSVDRLFYGLIHTVSRTIMNLPAMASILTIVLVLLSPWLLNLKPNKNNKSAIIFFAVVCAIMLLFPSYILGTRYVFERFAIFLIPSYTFIFSAEKTNKPNKLPQVVVVLLTIGVLSSLCLKTYKNHLFQIETQAIDSALNKLEPNQKVFYLVLDSYSQSNYHTTYLHYPAWYQVNKAGFIESNTDLLGNFARLAPFPVRYRPGVAPELIKDVNEKIMIDFKEYRYIIVRHQLNRGLSDIFTMPTCKPTLVDQVEKWAIYDTGVCRP